MGSVLGPSVASGCTVEQVRPSACCGGHSQRGELAGRGLRTGSGVSKSQPCGPRGHGEEAGEEKTHGVRGAVGTGVSRPWGRREELRGDQAQVLGVTDVSCCAELGRLQGTCEALEWTSALRPNETKPNPTQNVGCQQLGWCVCLGEGSLVSFDSGASAACSLAGRPAARGSWRRVSVQSA